MRVRTVLQMEAAECGAACLTMILDFHGVGAPLQEVRDVCAVSRDGINALRMVTAARSYGLTAQGYRKSLDELADIPTPFVVYWNQNHFVVVEKVGTREIRINDPASGRRSLTPAEFTGSFSAIVLTFAGDGGAIGDRRPRETPALLRLLSLLGRSRRGVIVAVIAGICQTIPVTAAAVLTALFAEQILNQGNGVPRVPLPARLAR